MLYPSSEILNKSPKNITEEPSAPTVTSWDIGRKTVVFTNVHTAIYSNPTTRNTCVSSNHSDLTADPKPPSNKNHPHHHPSPFASLIREGSKPENPPPPSHHQPPHHHLTEELKRTKERVKRRTTTPANKEKSKERLIELSMT